MDEASKWMIYLAALGILVTIAIPFIQMYIQDFRNERKKRSVQQQWPEVKNGKAWLFFISKEFTVNVGKADRIKLTVSGTSGVDLEYSVYSNGATPVLQRDEGKRYRRKWSPIIEIWDNNNKSLTFRCTTRFFFILARIHYIVEYIPQSGYISGSLGDKFSIKPDFPPTQPSIVGWPHNLNQK